jgi:photosystem II stability/assembly factor-like uncharacterized protein
MKKSLFLFYFFLFIIFNLKTYCQIYAWTETQPVANKVNNWRTTSINSDGMKMIAGATNGRLYLSSNAGITWKEVQPGGDSNMDWYISAMDSDGSKIIAGTAGYAYGRLYLTTDFGSSWSELQPAGNTGMNWKCAAISADGSTIAAGVGDFGRLFISKDSGNTWKETQPAGNVDKSWYTCSINSDGSRIIAGVFNGRLYISTDSGVSWTETQPDGNQNMSWYTTSMTSDGMKVIAGATNGKLYISNDGGFNWTETQPGGIVNGMWSTASINSYGSSIIAGTNDGNLYVVRPEINFPIIAVTYPFGGETLLARTTREITWVSYNISEVKIEYTTDNGTSWSTIINSTPASSGSFLWTVPKISSNKCRIRIGSTIDSTLSSMSYSVFTIEIPKVFINSPHGGENWLVLSQHYIDWSYSYVLNLKLEYSTDNGNSWSTIINSTPANSGSYLWTVPNTPSNNCKIKISSTNDSSVYRISDSIFSIRTPGVLISSPNGGENWQALTQHKITWMNFGLSNVNLEFTTNNGTSWSTIIASTPASDGTTSDKGSYLWIVPNILSSQCKVRISDASNADLFSINDSAFNILPPMIWDETQPAGDTNKYWSTTSMSADGSKIIAGVGGYYGGRLYFSTDSGNSWLEVQPAGNTVLSWQTTSMSADGTKIIAGTVKDFIESSGKLFISTDGGNSWNETQPAGNIDLSWQTTSMSYNGFIIIAGASGYPVGKLYISTDGGISWNEIQPAGNTSRFWSTTYMSPDGTKIIAGSGNQNFPGKLFISTNSGSSWNETQPIGNNTNIAWTTTSISPDGFKIIAGVSELGEMWDLPAYWLYNGRLYISKDGGSSWNETRPELNNSSLNNDVDVWYSTSMSSDGTKIIAGTNKNLDISTDGGTSWFETQPAGYSNFDWFTTSMTPDGSKIIAGTSDASNGRLFIYTEPATDVPKQLLLRKEYNLSQNYPNPFNPVTTINYQLPTAGIVTLKVYDILGREVATLVNEFKQAGFYKAAFNGSSLASGVYIYELRVNEFRTVKKLTVLK